MSLNLDGISLDEAATAVREKAIEMAAGGARGIWTEVGKQSVMVGLCINGAAAVLLISRTEYDGMRLLEILDGCAVP